MSLIKKIQEGGTGKSVTLSPGDYRGEVFVNTPHGASLPYFFGANGIDFKFSYRNTSSCIEAYKKCPPLTAVINRKAQSHINAKTWILNSLGKVSTSDKAKKIKGLMDRPNPFQNWKQFRAQLQVYIQLFGYCIVLPIIPIGYESFGPIEAKAMYLIPPYMVDPHESNVHFTKATKENAFEYIRLNYKGTQSNLPLKDIFIFKDTTVSFETVFFPESRVRSNEMPINNIIAAYESRNVLINYRGALGILTPDNGTSQLVPLPLTEGDKESLQNDFRRYGLTRQQWKFIIAPTAMKWQQMGIPTKELMLKEEVEDSAKAICDGWGFPPHLLGLIDPSFNNQNAAEKGLYQNTIIPEADNESEEWNEFFRTSEHNLRIEFDFSHLPVLQQNKVEEANARKIMDEALHKEFKNNLITLDYWLTKLGEDPRGDEFGKMYYYQLLELGWVFETQTQPQNGTGQENAASANQ